MSWWVWMVLGIALVVAEMATPSGFWIAGFGVGAFFVGALVWIGLGGPAWLQWLVFLAVSVGALLASRSVARRPSPSTAITDRALSDLIGDAAVLGEDLAPGATSKVELRGSVWTARNGGATTLVRGQRCRVQRVEGITLWLVAE